MSTKLSGHEGFADTETRDLARDHTTLNALVSAGRFNNDWNVGCESEVGTAYYETGAPAPVNRTLLPHLPRVQAELTQWICEGNSNPDRFRSGSVGWLIDQVSGTINAIGNAADRYTPGVRPFAHGSFLGAGRELMDLKYLSDKPRYPDLDRRLVQGHGGMIKVNIRGPFGHFEDSRPNMIGEGFIMSMQPHVQVPAAQIGNWYNLSLACAGLMQFLASNSPISWGEVLWPETRVAVWQEVIKFGRFSVGHYLREDTLEAILDYFRTITPGRCWVPLPTYSDGDSPLALKALSALNGQRWMYSTRLCYGHMVGEGSHVRLENRQFAMAPAPECGANFGMWLGLMEGIRANYGNAAAVMTHKQAEETFFHAAETWEGTQVWWCGEKVDAKHWWRTIGLQLVEQGLHNLGIDAGSTDRVLQCLRFRLEHGTGAEIVRRFWQNVDGPVAKKVKETTRLIVDNNENPYCAWGV